MNVIVLGAGFAGLCTATRLVRDGHHVTLLDRRRDLRAPAAADAPAPTVFPGFWRSARASFDRVGASHALRLQPRLRLAFVDGNRGGLARAAAGSLDLRLPLAFNRLGDLAAWGPLSLRDRAQALRVLAALNVPNRFCPSPLDGETIDAWLTRLAQPPGARRALWYPLALGTLDTEPTTASARQFEAALRSLLFGSREEACVSAAPLDASRLYADAALDWLRSHDATVRPDSHVERLRVRSDGQRTVVDGVELASGEALRADAVIAAVPPDRLICLLPEALREADGYFAALARSPSSARVTLRARFDREVSAHDSVCLSGYRFRQIVHRRCDDGSDAWLRAWGDADLSRLPDADLLRLGEAALRDALPAARDARLVRAGVVRDDDFGRPAGRTSVDNLFLVGGCVRTGLPVGLESAARSAEAAAAMVAGYEPPRPPANFVPVGRLRRAR